MHDLQFREIARDARIIGADGMIDALKDGGPGANSRSGKRSREGQKYRGNQQERAGARRDKRSVRHKARNAGIIK